MFLSLFLVAEQPETAKIPIMRTVHIIQKDDSDSGVLRKKALKVPFADISTPSIQYIIADMKAAIASQDDAVAIAAPQIGHSLRMFVIAGKIFTPSEKSRSKRLPPHLQKEHSPTGFSKKSDEKTEDRVFINPSISRLSRKKESVDEGCLSVRPLYGLVKRSIKATIRAHNEHGKPFEYGASGLLAQIFQHEMDHLSGILFTDKATKTWEYHPEDEDNEKE